MRRLLALVILLSGCTPSVRPLVVVCLPRFAGEHGYAGGTGVFFYRGPRAVTAGSIQAVDVAVTAAALLGIAPPRGASGVERVARARSWW